MGGKAEWCCHRYGYACTSTTTKPLYDCGAGYLNWKHGWSEQKKVWCCFQAKRGGTVTSTTATTTTLAPTTTQPSTTTEHDCFDSLHAYKNGWSLQKRNWCCQREHVGCVSSTTLSYYHECSIGHGPLVAEWSPAKQKWCCEQKNIGCSHTTSFLEYACGSHVPLSGWSERKRSWCCKAVGKGCSADAKSLHEK